jgi:hypothetical protein
MKKAKQKASKQKVKKEVSKQTEIIIVSVISVGVILLLLLFANVFVGKAVFHVDDVGKVGFLAVNDTHPGMLNFSVNVSNTFIVSTNISGKYTVAWSAEIEMGDFKPITGTKKNCLKAVNFLIDWNDQYGLQECSYNKDSGIMLIKQATFDYRAAVNETFDLFSIKVDSIKGEGDYDINLNYVEIFDLDSAKGATNLVTSLGKATYKFTKDPDGDGLEWDTDSCPYNPDPGCVELDTSDDGGCDPVCATGETCTNSVCMETITACIDDIDCLGGEQCTDLVCTKVAKACTADTDCTSPATCVEKLCKSPVIKGTIAIELYDGATKLTPTSAITVGKQYTGKIVVSAKEALPKDHFIVLTIEHGNKQRKTSANTMGAVVAPGTETLNFFYAPEVAGSFTVSAFVWQSDLKSKEVFVPLISKVEKEYGK